MNRKEIIDSITEDAVFMNKWRGLARDGTLDKMLELCNCYRSPYNKDSKVDPLPHAQSEHNGGMKAWEKLEYLIMSTPFKEAKKSSDPDQEYVGYVKDHVAKRRAQEFQEEDV